MPSALLAGVRIPPEQAVIFSQVIGQSTGHSELITSRKFELKIENVSLKPIGTATPLCNFSNLKQLRQMFQKDLGKVLYSLVDEEWQ